HRVANRVRKDGVTGPSPPSSQSKQQQEQSKAYYRFVQLNGVERHAERHATDRRGLGVGERHRPRDVRRSTVVVAGHEAADTANRLSECNRRSAKIGGAPEVEAAVAPKKYCARCQRTEEPAVEIAGAGQSGARKQ